MLSLCFHYGHSWGCTLMDSCGGCLAGDASLNITDCVWLQCDSGNSSCVWGSEVPEGCSLYNEASLCAGKRAERGQDAAQQSHFFHCLSNWDHNLDSETSLDLYNSISSHSSNKLGLPALCNSREGDWEREAGREGHWEERKGISETGKSGADALPPTVPTPVYKQANFDLSSFIGGIILVLGMQSSVFFIIKFFKTKDSTYQTM
ncbi:UNVERIFIED_CONTAM: hypothetical protein FKN15_030467 [Acipenser sinensis]